MSSANPDDVHAAVDWRVRLETESPEAWEAFVLWLEQDPAHGRAYETVAIADRELDEALARQEPAAVPIRAAIRGRWLAWAGAVAAVLLALIFLYPMSVADRYDVFTGPGEQRTVEIGEGSRIALNGGTRLTLDRDDPRYAALDSGEAMFVVRHDSRRPFAVHIGDRVVQDVGTAFNIVREGGALAVEVAQGSVVYDPSGAAVKLDSGDTLRTLERSGEVVLGARRPEQIGTWRTGRLSYSGAPLSRVAADLSRNLGTAIRVDAEVRNLPFTGTIRVDRDERRLFGRLDRLLDVSSRRSEDGWRIARGTSAAR